MSHSKFCTCSRFVLHLRLQSQLSTAPPLLRRRRHQTRRSVVKTMKQRTADYHPPRNWRTWLPKESTARECGRGVYWRSMQRARHKGVFMAFLSGFESFFRGGGQWPWAIAKPDLDNSIYMSHREQKPDFWATKRFLTFWAYNIELHLSYRIRYFL